MPDSNPLLRRLFLFTALAALILVSAAPPTVAQAPASKSSKTEDIAALLPADTLFHLEIDGAAAARNVDQLSVAKIMAEPEVKRFLKSVLGWLHTGHSGIEAQVEFLIDGTAEQVHELLKGKLTLSFLGIRQEMRKEEGMEWSVTVPQLLLTWNISDQTEVAERLLKSGRKLLKQETGVVAEKCDIAGNPGRKISFGGSNEAMYLVKDGLFIAGTDLDSITAFLARRGQPTGQTPCLATSKTYAKATQKLKRDGSIMRAFVNLQAALGQFGTQLPPDVRGMLGLTGIDDMTSISLSMEFDGGGVRERFFVGMKPASKLFNLYDRQQSVRAHKVLPAETGFLYSATLNWAGVYDYLMELFKALEPYEQGQVDEAIAQAGQMIGADIRKQILPMLGSEICVAAMWPHQGLIPDVALMLRVKDKKGVEALCNGLMERFGEGLRAGTLEYMDHTIHWFGPRRGPKIPGAGFTPQIRLSWVMIDEYLVFTPWPQAAKNLIRGISKGRPRLESNPDFKKVLAQLRRDVPGSGSSLIMYADLKGIAGFALDNGVPFVQSVIPSLESLGMPIDVDWSLWPTTGAITQHLEGFMATASVQDDGIYAEYYSPVGVMIPYMAGVAAFFAWSTSAEAREMAPGEPVMVEPESRPIRKK